MTLAALLGYAPIFDALSRLEQGQVLAADFDLLDGHWDLPDRLSLAFHEAALPPVSLRIVPLFHSAAASG